MDNVDVVDSGAGLTGVTGELGDVGEWDGGNEPATDDDGLLNRTNTRYNTTNVTTNTTTTPAMATPAIPPVPSDEEDDDRDVDVVEQLSPTATSVSPLHATRTATGWAGKMRDDLRPV